RLSDRDLGRGHASLSKRSVLPWFARSVGKEILLPAGRIGDEGWFAIASVRASWANAGPAAGDGLRHLLAGAGHRRFQGAGVGPRQARLARRASPRAHPRAKRPDRLQ